MATGGTYYVDTASSGGDGTTQNHSGATAAFATLSAAEAALQGTLTSNLTIYCAGGQDNTAVVFSGWTTASDDRIIIQGDPNAPDGDGKNDEYLFSTSYYYMENDSTHVRLLWLAEDYVTVDGIQLETSATAINKSLIQVDTQGATNEINIRNCKFKRSSANYQQRGVLVNDADTNSIIYNNLFDWGRSESGSDQFLDEPIRIANGDGEIYNNTIGRKADGDTDPDGDGIVVSSGATANVFNNCVFNYHDDMNFAGTVTSTYNAADDDDDSAGHQDMSPGGTESDGWSDNLVDWANGDWRIKNESSVLYDNGTTGGSTTDQNGVTFVTQDIGCFAFIKQIEPQMKIVVLAS